MPLRRVVVGLDDRIGVTHNNDSIKDGQKSSEEQCIFVKSLFYSIAMPGSKY
jgi:hypothetical protein